MRRILMGALGVLCLGMLTVPAGAQNQDGARAGDCRVVEMDPRRGPARQTLCMGTDGVWRPQETAAPAGDGPLGGGAFPADWSGRVTYTGTYQGAIETPGRAMRRLSIEEALRAASSARSEEIGGPYALELTIDGNAVSGRVITSGALRGAAVSGTRTGARCRLFIADILIEGECTAERFEGRARTQGDARRIYNYRISAEATDVVDAQVEAARREQAAAEAAVRQAAEQAERERAAATERARIAAMPRATAAQTALLERAVRQDSGAWAMNRYDVGSMSNVRVASTGGGATVLRGEYRYNGGSSGWVEARVVGGRVECLGYWDMGGCSAPRTAASTGRGPIGGGVPGTTVTVSALTWNHGYAYADHTGWFGFAHVRDMGGGITRIYEMSLLSGANNPAINLIDVDCRQYRYRTVESGRYTGDATTLFQSEEAFRLAEEGTMGRRLYETVCTRSQWRRVADPVTTAFDWVSQ